MWYPITPVELVQNVVRLDISVNVSPPVYVSEAVEKLSKNVF
jgi:hypothetical protein